MKKGRLNNGDTIKVTPEMYDEAANDFSEGNEGLRKLLMYCFENDIQTIGCCSGHNGESTPYIAFELNDQNMQPILKMLKNLKVTNSIECLILTKQPGSIANFIIHMKDHVLDKEATETFERVLRALQDEKEVEVSDLEENRQAMINSMQNHKIPNSYFEIQEAEDVVSIIIGKEYYNALEPGKKVRAWREGASLAEYLKKADEEELRKTLHRLEVGTKYYGCMEDMKTIAGAAKTSEISNTVDQIKQQQNEKSQDIEQEGH